MKYTAPILPPEIATMPPPERVQVAVVGGGLTGLSIASGLRDSGATVHLFEQRSAAGAGMATRGMGLASQLLLDPPHRLIQALGLSTAKEVLTFSAEGVACWGDGLNPTGVAYATKGAAEAEEIELNLNALHKMGFSGSPCAFEHTTELGPGWLMPNDGALNLGAVAARLTAKLNISTNAEVIDIEDDGMDLCVVVSSGHKTRADIVIMAGGAQLTSWTRDKFHPVRHQAIATAPVENCIPVPMHIQYGYTTARQLDNGAIMLSGCRWATPHMEVGETDDTLINPTVDTRLKGFLHQHWPHLKETPITHQWTGIMTFTCDGLPIIGPLPGRPRIITCGGFGAYSPSLSLRAAQAVVDGVTTGESPGVPTCFGTQRFS